MKDKQISFPVNAMMAQPPLTDKELANFAKKKPRTASSPPSIDPTTSLIKKINELHAEADRFVKTAEEAAYSAVENAFQAGLALLELKALVTHGEWSATLKKRCPQISQRTAGRYMKLARDYKDRPSELPRLPLREIYSLPSPGEDDPSAGDRKQQKKQAKKKSSGAIQQLKRFNSIISHKEFQSSLGAITPEERTALIKTLTTLLESLQSTAK